MERESALGIRETDYPSLFEDVDFLRFVKGLEIRSNAPELRVTELDQTDPAGRYRAVLDADEWSFQRALSANWATNAELIVLRRPLGVNQVEFRDTQRIVYFSGDLAIRHHNIVQYTGGSNSGKQYEFGALNSASAHTSVVEVHSQTDPGGVNRPSWRFVNVPVYIDKGIEGMANENLFVAPNPSNTGTARRFEIRMRNTAGSAVIVAQGVPNAASPFWTERAPDVAPGTSELDASNITLRYTSAGAVTLYVNDAGAIKSLSLGTPA